jgi:hypothetical protein
MRLGLEHAESALYVADYAMFREVYRRPLINTHTMIARKLGIWWVRGKITWVVSWRLPR